MAAWLECCYGAQPLLHLGDRTMCSCSGVQQGDPLGPFTFSLALHPIIEKIRRKSQSLRSMCGIWTMGRCVGPPAISVLLLSSLRKRALPEGCTSTERNISCINLRTAPSIITPFLQIFPSPEVALFFLVHQLALLPFVRRSQWQECRRYRTFCPSFQTFRTPNWKLLSFTLTLLSPKSSSLFVPVHPTVFKRLFLLLITW